MSNISVANAQIMDIPKIIANDGRGNLSIVELDFLPYKIKRVYYLYDIPSDTVRGGHAHKELYQFLIAVSGSFDVVLDDGTQTKRFHLNRPYQGLLIPSGLWRVLENFSAGAVCLSLVSESYDETDYIRSYQDFIAFKKK